MRIITVGLGLMLGVMGGTVCAEESVPTETGIHGHGWRGVSDDLAKQKLLNTFAVITTADRWGWIWRAVHPGQLPPLINFEQHFVLVATGPAVAPPTLHTALDESGVLTVTRSQPYRIGKKFSWLLQVHRREGVRRIGRHDLAPPQLSVLTLADHDRDFRVLLGERFVVELPRTDDEPTWQWIGRDRQNALQLVEQNATESDTADRPHAPMNRFVFEAVRAGKLTLFFQRQTDQPDRARRFEARLRVIGQADAFKTLPIRVRLKTPGDGWDVRVIALFRKANGDVRVFSELAERDGAARGGWTWAQDTVHITLPIRRIHHSVLGKSWSGLESSDITFTHRNVLNHHAKSQAWSTVDFIRYCSANRYGPRVRMIGFLPDEDIRQIADAVRRSKLITDKRIDFVRVLDPMLVAVKMKGDAGRLRFTAVKLNSGRWRVLTREKEQQLKERIRDAMKVPNR